MQNRTKHIMGMGDVMDSVDILNIVDRGEVTQNKMLEKLMYLMWYEHMKREWKRVPNYIYGNRNYELLAEKYYKEFGKTVTTWDIPNRNIGDL